MESCPVSKTWRSSRGGPLSELIDSLATLRDPRTIRARCAAITRAVSEGRSGIFNINRSKLADAARRVETSMRARYPDLVVPLHSRWRHFEAGGVDRMAELDALLAGRSSAEQARARFDLTVVSVLLDAGAGVQWRYKEPGHETSYSRSEGLGVASFRAFVNGAFSASPDDPLRADAAALQRIDAAALRTIFQASPSNPLVGLEGRAGLLSRLGAALNFEATRDGLAARPGLVFDRVTHSGSRSDAAAADVLQELLRCFAPIWANGQMVKGVPAGDAWPHRWAGSDTGSGPDPVTSGWVPFHKLSQWLTYSLLEPLQWAGVRVTGLEALTGLPEYRNGGLLIDCGVIVPRQPRDLSRTWKVGDEFVVEWRALTVTLLDEVATLVRQALSKTADEMPLARILEGGTWAAGREIAKELRDGAPPFAIDSDGTVF